MAERATPTYTKKVKFNYVITDIAGTPIIGDFEAPNYFKVDQFYPEMFMADITNILHELNGDRKVIEIATVANISNNQLYINKDTKQIGFFETPLTGECEVKSGLFFDLIEALVDEDLVKLYDIDGNRLYALKDGITSV